MQQSLGRYRLTRHLATGGMGEVYLAEAAGAAGFAKRLVIKTLRPELSADPRLVEQFVAEGRLLEALDHPNIAQILDLGVVEGTYFLAMEYVEGFDLRELRRALPEPARLGEGPTLGVLAATAEALHHAATRRGADGRPLGIVHHDVTPSNIMVRPDGHVKLVDFGVARSAVMARLMSGALRGKLPYLSPEQARLEVSDGRADIFSLGLVAYELLTGERALEVADPSALPAAHALLPQKLARLSSLGVSEPTRSLLQDMLALERSRRCATAAVVADRAKEVLVARGEPSSVRPLSEALQPAFHALEQRRSGFDHTLASLVAAGAGPGPRVGGAGDAGTVSLPGLPELGVAVAEANEPGVRPPGAAPALDVALRPVTAPGTVTLAGLQRQRVRKRVVFAAALVLLLAGAAGWWIGARGGRGPATPPLVVADARPLSPAPAAPLPSDGLDGAALDPPDARSPYDAGSAQGAVGDAPAGREGPDLGSPAWAPSPPGAATETGNPGAAAPGGVDGGTPASTDFDAGSRAEPTGRRNPLPSAGRLAGAPKGTFRFLVFPADCEVRVDGRPWPPSPTGRYALSLPAGAHVVVVRDPISGRQKRHAFSLEAGEQRTLPGGFRLVTDLP